MDATQSIDEILALIWLQGELSFASLIDALGSIRRPARLARAFQSARADGLIEETGQLDRSGDATYRLTLAGQSAVEQSAQTAAEAEVSWLSTPASLLQLLLTIGEFGEASLGLVAWELCVPDRAVQPTWAQALELGLLELGDLDPLDREQTARLTPLGSEWLRRSDERSA